MSPPGSGGGKTGQGFSHRYTRYLSRIVRLTYLQTLQIATDQRSAGEIAGETDSSGSSGNTSQGEKPPEWWDPLGLFGPSSRSKQWSYSLEDSGWSVTRSWLETFWDKIRYAIGIREIAAYNFRFAPSSELVSIPFSSPKEIIKIQLQVEEQIPQVLGVERRWIEYYVTVDDGENWLRINPLDHPTLYENGRVVPRTYDINIDVGGPTNEDVKSIQSDAPVKRVRFRAVFFTDTTILNGDRYTPVLKRYRMKLYPRGGLSSPDSETL